MLCARVFVYGTKDAGRSFWIRLREAIVGNSWKENPIMPAMYSLYIDGRVRGMLCSHVDDALWSVEPGYEAYLEAVLKELEVKEVNDDKFRFFGREIVQDESCTVTITCRDTAERIDPIRFSLKGRKPDERATSVEISQFESVVGSLSLVARQARPSLSYMVSHLQSIKRTATIKDLKDCNNAAKETNRSSNEGIVYKAAAVDPDNWVLVSVNDSGWAQEETEVVYQDEVERESFRSQQGRLLCMANPSALEGKPGPMYLWSWKSSQSGKVSRSTLHAETQATVDGADDGIRWRAVIGSMSQDLRIKHWEADCARVLKILLATDCKSLSDHVTCPKFNRPKDKRAGIE